MIYGYDVHHSKITQNSKKESKRRIQSFANLVFYGGAAFSSLVLAGTAAL